MFSPADKLILRRWDFWFSIVPLAFGCLLIVKASTLFDQAECLTHSLIYKIGGISVCGILLSFLALGWQTAFYESSKSMVTENANASSKIRSADS
jgi:hypothetical protein